MFCERCGLYVYRINIFYIGCKTNFSNLKRKHFTNMTKSAIPSVICFPKRLKNISTIDRLMYTVRKTCERDGTRARVLEWDGPCAYQRTASSPCTTDVRHSRSSICPHAHEHISPFFLVRCLLQSVKTLVNPGGSGDPLRRRPPARSQCKTILFVVSAMGNILGYLLETIFTVFLSNRTHENKFDNLQNITWEMSP